MVIRKVRVSDDALIDILSRIKSGESQSSIAKSYDVTQPAIWKIKNQFMKEYEDGKLIKSDTHDVDYGKEIRRQNELIGELSGRVGGIESRLDNIGNDVNELRKSIRTVNMLVDGLVELDKRIGKMENTINSLIR